MHPLKIYLCCPQSYQAIKFCNFGPTNSFDENEKHCNFHNQINNSAYSLVDFLISHIFQKKNLHSKAVLNVLNNSMN